MTVVAEGVRLSRRAPSVGGVGGHSGAPDSNRRERPMGEILGRGITHYPPLCYKGNMSRRINMLLADPGLPEKLRTPAGWDPKAREQWSNDEGAKHSDAHRNDLIHHFRKARAELDAFKPDFVL